LPTTFEDMRVSSGQNAKYWIQETRFNHGKSCIRHQNLSLDMDMSPLFSTYVALHISFVPSLCCSLQKYNTANCILPQNLIVLVVKESSVQLFLRLQNRDQARHTLIHADKACTANAFCRHTALETLLQLETPEEVFWTQHIYWTACRNSLL